MSAARTLRQLTTTASRLSTRQFSTASLSRLPVLAKTASNMAANRAFSVSAPAFKAGASDMALTQKLADELAYEVDANAEALAGPEFLKEFQEQGIWTIKDEPGNNEVTLSRQFGNETIRVLFSVADLQAQEDDELPEEDEDQEQEPPQGDMIRAVVTITKSTGPGALEIDLTAQSGQFLVENVAYFEDAKLSHDNTIEGDWKRRALYIGPEFGTLDVAVQEQFETFLDERDIGESTSFFVLEYAQHKEQKEYIRWLDSVKGFVDA